MTHVANRSPRASVSFMFCPWLRFRPEGVFGGGHDQVLTHLASLKPALQASCGHRGPDAGFGARCASQGPGSVGSACPGARRNSNASAGVSAGTVSVCNVCPRRHPAYWLKRFRRRSSVERSMPRICAARDLLPPVCSSVFRMWFSSTSASDSCCQLSGDMGAAVA